jgi:hypothetical protein
VHYTAAQTRHLLDDIEKIVGPHRRAVAAGGWTQMASVRTAKAAVIDALSFSPVVQPGVTGAALRPLHHAGRPPRCERRLGDAAEAAARARREDLLRTARANRVELLINRCDWEAATLEIEDLLALAQEQHDDVRLLVALHHRSRLALRRGS